MSKVFFTSDEHYGHRNIIKFCNRPFTDLDDMREGLIARHNERVAPGDTVYHLGDMFWRTTKQQDASNILARLNGNHVYVRGNHEELFDQAEFYLRFRFDSVHERLYITPDGGPKAGVVLDHFAGRVWHKSDKGSWQLYGHSHGELPEDHNLLSFDVGVDANNWYPVSLTQVAERMHKKIEWMHRRLLGGRAR